MDRLNDRELRILQMAARGLSSREISNVFGCSDRSVDLSSHRACQKIGVRNRIAAVAVAVKRGWIDGPEVET